MIFFTKTFLFSIKNSINSIPIDFCCTLLIYTKIKNNILENTVFLKCLITQYLFNTKWKLKFSLDALIRNFIQSKLYILIIRFLRFLTISILQFLLPIGLVSCGYFPANKYQLSCDSTGFSSYSWCTRRWWLIILRLVSIRSFLRISLFVFFIWFFSVAMIKFSTALFPRTSASERSKMKINSLKRFNRTVF